jgi:hypothetical protein
MSSFLSGESAPSGLQQNAVAKQLQLQSLGHPANPYPAASPALEQQYALTAANAGLQSHLPAPSAAINPGGPEQPIHPAVGHLLHAIAALTHMPVGVDAHGHTRPGFHSQSTHDMVVAQRNAANAPVTSPTASMI